MNKPAPADAGDERSFRYGAPGAPTRHHATERAVPTSIGAIIESLAPALWGRFAGFGFSAGIDCTAVVPVWVEALRSRGVAAHQVDGYTSAAGGYLGDHPTEPIPHTWLMVGEGRWIFDPTWRQFHRFGEARLDRYRVFGNTDFAAWRKNSVPARSPRLSGRCLTSESIE